jgi:hypothetical protein
VTLAVANTVDDIRTTTLARPKRASSANPTFA